MTMIPLASFAAKTLGKRIGKVTTEQMNFAAILNSYLVEIFKNHKLTKIFQMENFEEERADKFINNDKIILWISQNPIYENHSKYIQFPYGINQNFLNDYINFIKKNYNKILNNDFEDNIYAMKKVGEGCYLKIDTD